MYKIDKLLKQDRKLFHTNDLGILWNITNKNTLYTAIKRFVQKGILIPLQKGLYSTIPIDRLDMVKLGMSLINRYSYLSTETSLIQAGLITQTVYPYTFVSDVSRKFHLDKYQFLTRKMHDKYLYNDTGISKSGDLIQATPERAVADLLYFNPKYHFDQREMIDWKKVRQIRQEVGFI